MTSYPLMMRGEALSALVVGGGSVAWRKVAALTECGATVRVVAPEISAELRSYATRAPVTLVEREYESRDIGDAMLVIAATNTRETNHRVATDARALGRLVNVTDVPDEGNCTTAAVHRAGPLTVAVSTGRIPRAASRIRDRIGLPFDARYTEVLDALTDLRHRLLAHGARDAWHEAERGLIGPDFCDMVEAGSLLKQVHRWG